MRSLDRGTPIVAVSINYRLNIFGFAASSAIMQAQDRSGIQGVNFGLHDQKVALTWISRNIAAFCGDPDRITIGGQSAGSTSVHALLLDAESGSTEQPLFRRAIMQSGAMGTMGPDSIETANCGWEDLCRYWGLGGEPSDRKVALLRRVRAEELFQSAGEVLSASFPAVFDNATIQPGSLVKDNISVDLGPTDLHHGPVRPSKTSIDVLMGMTDWEVSPLPEMTHETRVFVFI